MAKVCVVTSGEYSDYGIDAVFDNRAAAEAYCALGHGEYVEEYDLLTEVATTAPVDYVYAFCVGDLSQRRVSEPAYILRSGIEAYKAKIKKWYSQRGSIVTNTSHIDRYVFLDENNPDLALKIVQDRIAEYKARKAGL